MILLDSNLFIVDRFFPRDALYPQNRVFVEQLAELETAISVFTLIEVCGVASFNLSSRELEHWLYQFPTVYPVLVLDPFDLAGQSAADWVKAFLAEVSVNIAHKMTFGDALILREAEAYQADAIITWNTKDFLQRTRLPVLTPTAYLDARQDVLALRIYEWIAYSVQLDLRHTARYTRVALVHTGNVVRPILAVDTGSIYTLIEPSFLSALGMNMTQPIDNVEVVGVGVWLIRRGGG